MIEPLRFFGVHLEPHSVPDPPAVLLLGRHYKKSATTEFSIDRNVFAAIGAIGLWLTACGGGGGGGRVTQPGSIHCRSVSQQQ